MSLGRYHQKRDFAKTPEPEGHIHNANKHRFSIQKHAASHLHYDFRIELNGVLKSWAVPKGPSLDPKIKRLAMHVEDHPIEYGVFEGTIPKGEYGGGTVMLWDKGTWEPLDNDPEKAYNQGHLRFELHAQKLGGRWDLIRFKKEKNSWFLVKYNDDYARSNENFDITLEEPNSVLTNQSIDEIAGNWSKSGLNKAKSTPQCYKNLPKKPMPKKIAPQLATLVDKPLPGDEWLNEVKFDGYRILAFKEGSKVVLFSRNQNDWTKNFQQIADAIKGLAIENAIFDGEIVLLDKNNRSNFQDLQNAIKSNKNEPFIYYIFDLLYYENRDLRSLPLIERKMVLESLLNHSPANLRYSDHIIGRSIEVYNNACDFALEGIISKEKNSKYLSRRSKSWLKIKCIKRQEFIIGGFSPPKNSRSHFGSLFLGVYEQGNLLFCGNVGTGFTQSSLKEVYNELKKRVITENPFSTKPPGSTKATWVKPELIAEVEFTQWTAEGRLRHPSFKGLRHDKETIQVVREIEQSADNLVNKPSVRLTHPEKILYKEDGITKQNLYDYYEEISSYILPFLVQRPLTLVRCPEKYNECFYQKKLIDTNPGLHPITITTKKDAEGENYIYIDGKQGLLHLVQMSVLELHPWGSRIEDIECPDMLTFDLDPSPEVQWKNVVKAAFEVKHYLEKLKLRSFVKTTGGKGLHVVVPIKPEYGWEEIKQFTHGFVQYLERSHPDKYISTMSKEKRKGKIFIDYLRNQRGATAISAYSTRARPHAPVATPLDWDELTDNIQDTYYTINTLPERLIHLAQDPWNCFWKIRQSLQLDE